MVFVNMHVIESSATRDRKTENNIRVVSEYRKSDHRLRASKKMLQITPIGLVIARRGNELKIIITVAQRAKPARKNEVTKLVPKLFSGK